MKEPILDEREFMKSHDTPFTNKELRFYFIVLFILFCITLAGQLIEGNYNETSILVNTGGLLIALGGWNISSSKIDNEQKNTKGTNTRKSL